MHDDVYQEFINECEESIDELNNALLELEGTPDDADAMDRIFRRAHTLKGNFGAMGFEGGATVAHAVEDLLDAVRDGDLAVTPELMDLVFAGVDRIEAIVADIEATGEPATDVTDTVAEIRAALDEDGAPETPEEPDTDDVGESAVPDRVLDAVDDGESLLRVTVTLETGEMRSVDAGLFLGDLPEELDRVGHEPPLTALEAGEFDDDVDLYVRDDDGEAVAATIEDCWGVTEVSVERVGESEGTEAGAETEWEPKLAEDEAEAATDEDTAEDRRTPRTEVRSVRIDVGQLDELHELVEQLVTSRIKLRRLVDGRGDRAANDAMDELEKISGNLQSTVMDMRLIPLRKVVSKFPRLVRDLARSQEKDIEFTIEGDNIELDRTILDEISDPLMHVLRNAADHGIESPDEREAAGKSRTGHIELTATREQDHVVIDVVDDGGGIDAAKVREKAVERGVGTPEELEAMSDREVYDLVFHPGFSTADEVTDVSGRGVGMDVVRTTVRKLDGSVTVDSTPGEGTHFSIRLPVSVAIIKILLVKVGQGEFGVPVSSVDEVLGTDGVRTVNGREVLSHEERIYPLVHLREALDVGGPTGPPDSPVAVGDGGVDTGGVDLGLDARSGMLVRIKHTERPVALHCDRVTQQEEVVVKPFEGPLHDVQGLSGAAVIGDGNIIPILDVGTLPVPGEPVGMEGPR